MDFSEHPLDQADGVLLAHAIAVEGRVLKKGHRLDAETIALIRDQGRTQVLGARLGPDDVHEDEAAAQVAEALAGPNVRVARAFTGRVNLYAATRGLVRIDEAMIRAVNRIDESITVATLADDTACEGGEMLATIKIIPFAAPRPALEKVLASIARAGRPAIRIAPWRVIHAALIMTELPHLKEKIYEETARAIGARLMRLGARAPVIERVPHDRTRLARAMADLAREPMDLIVVAGASAIVDRADVIPAALTDIGGTVVRLGMPVDPGNLLMLGRLAGRVVIGAPGCARSPKMNGFDRVLERAAAGEAIEALDIADFGVGGLLKEVGERPLPRAAASPGPRRRGPRAVRNVAGVVLAAGRGTRMGPPNKLVRQIMGKPLIGHVLDAALESRLRALTVVTGPETDVRLAIGGRPVPVVVNEDPAAGMSLSLSLGLADVPEGAEAAVVLLADMPGISARHLDRLIDAYDPDEGRLICVPVYKGRRGNPVLFDRRFFTEMMSQTGDRGAREVVRAHEDVVVEVEMPDAAILGDIDTPEALAAADAAARAQGLPPASGAPLPAAPTAAAPSVATSPSPADQG
ncbi:molybdopterin-binding/glycosyltransferase family 2 protein [Tistrella sp. BH-R2-4]|uniref:Molybdopterin-binding/glycosyltransferase family 2 protein n=1 Tax=Tistrella arctica TaxID=3133430 RepID=A0ABU9YI50_9PROT